MYEVRKSVLSVHQIFVQMLVMVIVPDKEVVAPLASVKVTILVGEVA